MYYNTAAAIIMNGQSCDDCLLKSALKGVTLSLIFPISAVYTILSHVSSFKNFWI